MNDKKRRKPLLLVKNRQYPAYQLYAVTVNNKTPPEAALVIAVLQTMQWLRERFRELDIPDQLKMPDVENYKDVSINDFRSFHIDEGYKVDVIWLPTQKNWTLQLIEPDLGPTPGEESQARVPVPGRLIETNIAYHINDRQVECAFRAVISEPISTDSVCEAFRFGCIKHLARNPLLGLKQGFPLIDTAVVIDKSDKVKQLASWLKDKDRMLPAVIAIEKNTNSTPSIPTAEEFKQLISQSKGLRRPAPMPFNVEVKPEKQPVTIQGLARYNMGYAQYFLLPAEKKEEFERACVENISYGDLILWEPIRFGGEVKAIPLLRQETQPEAVEKEANEFVQSYPIEKRFEFGNTLFVPDARLAESTHMLELSESKKELLSMFAEKEQALNEIHNEEKMALSSCIRDLEKKIERLKAYDNERETEIATKLAEAEKREQKLILDIIDRNAELKRLDDRKYRPVYPKDVNDWVKEQFTDKLIFHRRAEELMADVQSNEVDMNLLCDALEYLATDYRDELIGVIDEHECNLRCSRKYNRPFDVTPINERSIETYPKEYKIKYYLGYNGKPVESPLNLHLRVGNDSENLLRIYFLYDKDKQLIVVGSLPKHLKTLTHC